MEKILRMYNLLYSCFGPQNWWPAESRLEVIVGAVLTQNTNWQNVEKAIDSLKKSGFLTLEKLKEISVSQLAQLIRPAGYFNVKAIRLKNLIDFIDKNYGGDLDKMFSEDLYRLRNDLLTVKGLGMETVDSILLYAGNKPIFVIDAYTKRIFSRCGLCFDDVSYEELQDLITRSIPVDVKLYNEFHALLVKLGKNFCKKRNPDCQNCPIKEICSYGRGDDRQL